MHKSSSHRRNLQVLWIMMWDYILCHSSPNGPPFRENERIQCAFSLYFMAIRQSFCETGLVPKTLVPRWFKKQRGRAMGLLSLGWMGSQALLPAVNTYVISSVVCCVTVDGAVDVTFCFAAAAAADDDVSTRTLKFAMIYFLSPDFFDGGCAAADLSTNTLNLAPMIHLHIPRHFGWRTCWLLWAVVLIVVMLPIVHVWMVNDPQDLGGSTAKTYFDLVLLSPCVRSVLTAVIRAASDVIRAVSGVIRVVSGVISEWRDSSSYCAFTDFKITCLRVCVCVCMCGLRRRLALGFTPRDEHLSSVHDAAVG
jgi:MFS family permease